MHPVVLCLDSSFWTFKRANYRQVIQFFCTTMQSSERHWKSKTDQFQCWMGFPRLRCCLCSYEVSRCTRLDTPMNIWVKHGKHFATSNLSFVSGESFHTNGLTAWTSASHVLTSRVTCWGHESRADVTCHVLTTRSSVSIEFGSREIFFWRNADELARWERQILQLLTIWMNRN